MPRVTILRRELTVHFPAPRQAEEVVAVTYVTDALGVRSVMVPTKGYRVATDEELAAKPRYRMVPFDKATEDVERKVIQADLEGYARKPPDSFDVP